MKAFPKRKEEIEQTIVVLKVLMQILTFAQFGALLYTFVRTQWHKRHETADKFNKLKKRASSIGGRLRSRSNGDNIDRGGDLEAAATVMSGDDDAASSTEEVGGAIGSGDKNGVELQVVSRRASTDMDDSTHVGETKFGDSAMSVADLRYSSKTSRQHAVDFATNIFATADKNGDGTLTKTEIRKYFKANPEDKYVTVKSRDRDNEKWC